MTADSEIVCVSRGDLAALIVASLPRPLDRNPLAELSNEAIAERVVGALPTSNPAALDELTAMMQRAVAFHADECLTNWSTPDKAPENLASWLFEHEPAVYRKPGD